MRGAIKKFLQLSQQYVKRQKKTLIKEEDWSMLSNQTFPMFSNPSNVSNAFIDKLQDHKN